MAVPRTIRGEYRRENYVIEHEGAGGDKMKPTEISTKTPTAATGFFATLCGLLHSKGSGAPKISLGRRLTLTPALCLIVLSVTTGVAQAATPETPETGKANPATITATTATLEDGVLNPNTALGELAEYEYRFRVSATECEGEEATAGMAAGGKKEVVPPVELTSLQPNVQYTFCLFERNLATGETSPASPVEHFTTKPAPPTIRAESRDEVSSTSATLEAYINPNNESTKYIFEYSTSESNKKLTGTIVKVNGASELSAEFGVQRASVATGAVLAPGTTYYYHVIAQNAQSEAEDMTAEGAVEHFTTVSSPSTEPVTAVEATTATFNGRLSPLNPKVAAQYHFDYNRGGICTGGSETPLGEAGVGAGGGISKATMVSGLQPDTIYTVCFVTANVKQGSIPITAAPVTFRTLPAAYVTEVSSSSVSLHAVLDPEASATTYRFQYGPSPTYGLETSEADAGSGTALVSVEVPLQALSIASVYHYRVIAVNAAHEIFTSEDHSFTTLPAGTGAFALPDDRQYELVSPPDKYGALVEPIGIFGVIESSAQGDAFTYHASAPTEAQPQGNANASQILARRTADGWSDQDIATPNGTVAGVTIGNGEEYRFFSANLSQSLLEKVGQSGFTTYPGEETAPDAMEHERTPYMRHDFSCPSPACYTPLVTKADVTSGVALGGERSPVEEAFRGATPDLSHVVLSASAPLTKATPTAPEAAGLYEWSAAAPPLEQLQLVSVLPAAEGGGPAGGAAFGAGEGRGDESRNAISNDGSRIIWTAEGEDASMYMRDTARGETVRLDAVQGGSGEDPEAGGLAPKAQFDMANSDGSIAFFTDTQRLAADSRGEWVLEGGQPAPDLYGCNIVEVEEAGHTKLKCDLTDLSPDSNPGEEPADVQGSVLGASEDGSYVYFVADGVLGDGGEHGASTGNCGNKSEHGAPGQTCNLYVEHYNGESKTWEAPRFIATLSGADSNDWKFGNLGAHTSGSSPNGHYLAFMSERDLTGYDTADASSGDPDEEVYLYDALTGKLVCASCNPTGARPVGEEYGGEDDAKSDYEPKIPLVGGYVVWPDEQWLAANIPGWVTYSGRDGAHQPRYLSNSGRLFFNSHDALVPQDANDTWDVYEYEPPGVGDCTPSTQRPSDVYDPNAEGCVGLISSGESSEESAFLDASESGGDVFFMTLSQLVPQDVDHYYDVYDAHECTGESPCFPASAETPPPCTTEASCKPAPEVQPSIYGLPSSATFAGPGNLAPPPPAAVKTVAKKAVKCKKDERKNKKGKCALRKKKSKKQAKRASNDRRAGR
jgi:hypothetical protein